MRSVIFILFFAFSLLMMVASSGNEKQRSNLIFWGIISVDLLLGYYLGG